MKAAADIYDGGVEVDIQIEEGSLITRITVVGGLVLGAYSTIADYKGFKDSVTVIALPRWRSGRQRFRSHNGEAPKFRSHAEGTNAVAVRSRLNLSPTHLTPAVGG